MDNNVVEALERAALTAGWAALKFNFRGVWPSTGEHGHGQGEQEDVLAAAWLRQRLNLPLGLLGYSFGALVGSTTAGRLGPIAAGTWIALALVLGPLEPWPPDTGSLLGGSWRPRPPYTHLGALEGYTRDLGARGRLISISEGDYFFGGGESALIRDVSSWLAMVPL